MVRVYRPSRRRHRAGHQDIHDRARGHKARHGYDVINAYGHCSHAFRDGYGQTRSRLALRQFLIQNDLALHQRDDQGAAHTIFHARKRSLRLLPLRPVQQRQISGGQTLAQFQRARRHHHLNLLRRLPAPG